ncbi:hypothetical protein RchiOBHm_Chr1g0354331 [Rosa chinensis]|uniref:Uncharacterized protein n=1 Tax=Rosa chinensis TaxID=74649 RepID=A0A2P6SH23_ROSCH|nr:hypothetical protein RchiOBHm_Chr1g0354331 [Rosa chinensis]
MGFSQQYSYIVVLLVVIVICGLSLVCLVSQVLTLEEPERGLTIVKLTHVDVPEEDSGSPSHPTANEASTNTKENFQADELMDDMMKISCNDWFEL